MVSFIIWDSCLRVSALVIDYPADDVSLAIYHRHVSGLLQQTQECNNAEAKHDDKLVRHRALHNSKLTISMCIGPPWDWVQFCG